MSSYKKLKDKTLAESLMEAAKQAKAHSPVGNRDQGDYYDMKCDDGVKDRLNDSFKKLKAKMSKKK